MDTLFFYMTKLGALLLSPETLLLLVLIIGFLLLFTKGHQKAARWCLGLPLAFSVLLACLPVDEWLLYPLEKRFLANTLLVEPVHGILVLGGGIDGLSSASWQQPQLNAAADRMSSAVALSRRYPTARVVFTGGSGMPLYQTIREADFARQFFIQQGLPEERVFFENVSRNTHENAVYSKQLVEPGPEENWVLLTSAAHMPRAVGAFCQQNWQVQPWPVDHRSASEHLLRLEFDFAGNLAGLNQALYEWAGLLVYFVSGKTTQLFPDGCQTESGAQDVNMDP